MKHSIRRGFDGLTAPRRKFLLNKLLVGKTFVRETFSKNFRFGELPFRKGTVSERFSLGEVDLYLYDQGLLVSTDLMFSLKKAEEGLNHLWQRTSSPKGIVRF